MEYGLMGTNTDIGIEIQDTTDDRFMICTVRIFKYYKHFG
jgi:hypothetical protein